VGLSARAMVEKHGGSAGGSGWRIGQLSGREMVENLAPLQETPLGVLSPCGERLSRLSLPAGTPLALGADLF